jgi:hypothetical protein
VRGYLFVCTSLMLVAAPIAKVNAQIQYATG